MGNKERLAGYEAYPLNLQGKGYEQQDLYFFNIELQNRSSGLFLNRHDECCVDILEIAAMSRPVRFATEIQDPSADRCNEDQREFIVKRLSTFAEMDENLNVNQSEY